MIPSPFRFFTGFCLLAALILFIPPGCRVLRPEKPAESYRDAAPALQPSLISIPFVSSAAALKKLINSELKGVIYSDTSFEDHDRDDLKVRVTKSDSIGITVEKNEVLYQVPVKVWLRKRISAGLPGFSVSTEKEANAGVVLKFRTAVSLGSDWKIKTLTRADGYEWTSYPKLTLGAFQLPMPVISDMLMRDNLPVVSREIDRSFREAFDLRASMTGVWNSLGKPVLISPEYQLWLKVTPLEVSSLPFHMTPGTVGHSVCLKALVEVTSGPEPPAAAAGELPPLKITGAVPENFNVNFTADLPFTQIDMMAARQFNGYVFSYGSYRITVRSVSVYGQDRDLIVALTVDGSVKGTLYLSGRPEYDREEKSILLTGLDFQVSTKNALVKTASWMFHSGLLKKLSAGLVFPVGDQLDGIRGELRRYLEMNKKISWFSLSGDVGGLEPDRIVIMPESVRAFFRFGGKVKVSL